MRYYFRKDMWILSSLVLLQVRSWEFWSVNFSTVTDEARRGHSIRQKLVLVIPTWLQFFFHYDADQRKLKPDIGIDVGIFKSDNWGTVRSTSGSRTDFGHATFFGRVAGTGGVLGAGFFAFDCLDDFSDLDFLVLSMLDADGFDLELRARGIVWWVGWRLKFQ